MRMTSVSGHLTNFDFEGIVTMVGKAFPSKMLNFYFLYFVEKYRKWYSCPPAQLFDLPVTKKCQDENGSKIKVFCVF